MSETNIPNSDPTQPERFTDPLADFTASPPEPETSVSFTVQETSPAPKVQPLIQPAKKPVPNLSPTELANLVAQVQQLRQHNTELVNWGMQLESELETAKRSIEDFKRRSPALETLITQRQEEIEALTEHNTRLLKELELSHQTAQRQQILIETLTEQLETNQQQVAQLERECALIQQRCNEQASLLLQAAEACREMRSRLYRQQRYTLQFKTALTRSLEVSESTPETPAPPQHQKPKIDPKFLLMNWGIVPKAPAIQPWSVGNQLEELEVTETEPEFDRVPTNLANLEAYRQAIAASEPVSPVENLSPVEFQPQPAVEISFNLTQHIPHVEPYAEPIAETDATPELESLEITEAEMTETLDESSLEMETVDPDEAPASETVQPEPLLPQANWPSPVVYPLRTPKKIGSLAAIQLPTFPRLGTTMG